MDKYNYGASESIFDKLPEGPYDIILADPPWDYERKHWPHGGVNRHYDTVPLSVLKTLPVSSICNKNAFLFMWMCWPFLKEAIELGEAWGFSYHTIGFVWVKTYPNTSNCQLYWGPGNYTRANTEPCLIFRKGKGLRVVTKNIHSIIMAPFQGHSVKPLEVRENIINLFGDNCKRLELFSRTKYAGFDMWGNQVGEEAVLPNILFQDSPPEITNIADNSDQGE